MIIGVDLDGCAANFGYEVKETLTTLKHVAVQHELFNQPIEHWYFYRDWVIDDTELVEICNNSVDMVFIFTNFDYEVKETLTTQKHVAVQHELFNQPIEHWYFYRDWGIEDSEFVEICNQGVDMGIIFSKSPMHRFTKDAFDLIKAKGHEIH